MCSEPQNTHTKECEDRFLQLPKTVGSSAGSQMADTWNQELQKNASSESMKEVLKKQLTPEVPIYWHREVHTTHTAAEVYVTMQTTKRNINVTPIVQETKIGQMKAVESLQFSGAGA